MVQATITCQCHRQSAGDQLSGGALFRRVSISARLTRPEQELACLREYCDGPVEPRGVLPGGSGC